MAEQLRGTELIVEGYIKVYLDRTGGWGQDKEITAAAATAGIEDILVHLLLQQRAWNRDWRTWAMVRQGREVKSQMEYIMGSDRRIFQNMAVRDLRHNSNHYMVLGCLHGGSLRENSNYLGRRTRLPLCTTV